jgi:hypothetical protein
MKRGAIVFVLLFLTASALGQTVTGIAPFTSQSSADFGSINLGSLNLHLEFPVINKAGRGLAFNYALTYDNSIWVPITVNSVTTWQPTTMWYGWSATKKPVGGYVIYKSTTLRCYPPGYPTEPSYLYQRYTYYAYVDRSGVTHPFGLVLDDDCSTNQSGTATATDSGITLSSLLRRMTATETSRLMARILIPGTRTEMR